MRPTFDRRLWILLFIILIQCIHKTNPLDIAPTRTVAAAAAATDSDPSSVRPATSRWIPQRTRGEWQHQQHQQQQPQTTAAGDRGGDSDNNNINSNNNKHNKVTTQKCANKIKNKCFDSKEPSASSTSSSSPTSVGTTTTLTSSFSSTSLLSTLLPSLSGPTDLGGSPSSVEGDAGEENPNNNYRYHQQYNNNNKHYYTNQHNDLYNNNNNKNKNNYKLNNIQHNIKKPSQLPSTSDHQASHTKNPAKKPHNKNNTNINNNNNNAHTPHQLRIAQRQHQKELQLQYQRREVDAAGRGVGQEDEEEEGEDNVEQEEDGEDPEEAVEGRRNDGVPSEERDDDDDADNHRLEFDMTRTRRERRQVEAAQNDDESFEEAVGEREAKAAARRHHKQQQQQQVTEPEPEPEKPEDDGEEDENGEGDEDDDGEHDVGGGKDNNDRSNNNNNNKNNVHSFPKASASSSASMSSGSGEAAASSTSSSSSSSAGSAPRSATASSSTSSGSGSVASSSDSASSTQSNSEDESAAAGLFGSQELSSSLEDLLASQMPDLLAITFGNESTASASSVASFQNLSLATLAANLKRTRSTNNADLQQQQQQHRQQPVIQPHEPIIIIDDAEEFDSGTDRERLAMDDGDDKNDDYSSHGDGDGGLLEPRVLPLRPLIPSPYEDGVHAEEMSVVYAEQHSEIRLMCEVDLDIATSIWYKNGLVVHAMDRTSRVTDYRFIKEANGGLTITNVMLEDDGKWQCEAENARAYVENARPVKLVVLDRPKPPYLLIDSRRLDAGNIFVPVKENSELNLACISEGGNPKPTLTWEVLLSPGVDRHAQKVSAEVLELEEIKSDKDKQPYKINSGAKSEARLPAVYRAHHNARILCVMEHPTLKIRQNASLLLDVQYTPSFAISRTPGFGYPLREGIEVSLKCDVDSNPPSTPRWQKDDGDTPVPQTGDGFLNFSSIRREHSGWYKCTSRHLNFQYSSIGYYLSVRYDSVDVTSEPDDQDVSVAAASHNPNKGQLEVQLGGAVTLQCPQGSLGCWSHLDPVTARLRGLGHGLSTPTGQFSLKDVVYQDAGTYKCIGQSPTNKKKLEVLQTVGVSVKGAPTVMARNATPVAYPGSPLHLTVEFCANPPAHAARWLHGDRVFTPGNQYGSTVLAYGVTDLPTPYCKEARLTYVSMHERVPRTFYFIVSSPGGVAEAVFKVNFTMRYRAMSNAIDDEEEELSEPEEIHFPVFGDGAGARTDPGWRWLAAPQLLWLWLRLRSCRWL